MHPEWPARAVVRPALRDRSARRRLIDISERSRNAGSGGLYLGLPDRLGPLLDALISKVGISSTSRVVEQSPLLPSHTQLPINVVALII